MQRIKVVLPAPFGPTRLSNSPCVALKLIPSKTFKLPKCLRTCSTAIALAPELASPANGAGAAGRKIAVWLEPVASALRRRKMCRMRGAMPRGIATITTTKASR